MAVLSYVIVTACSNNSAYDNCNNPNSTGWCWSNLSTTIPGILGFWPPDVDSLVGQHYGCWGSSSDNGTDSYVAYVRNDWRFLIPIFNSSLDNATVSYNLTPPTWSQHPPVTDISVSVPWHIGASGGSIVYNVDLVIQGPIGVPFP